MSKTRYGIDKGPKPQDYSRGILHSTWGVTMILFVIALLTIGLLNIDRFTRVFQTETRDMAFRSSTAHVVGTIDDLNELYSEWSRDDISANRKAGFEAMAKNLAVQIDMEDDRVPDYLRSWITSLTTNPSTTQ